MTLVLKVTLGSRNLLWLKNKLAFALEKIKIKNQFLVDVYTYLVFGAAVT